MLLSLPFKSWLVILGHQSVQYCLALPFLSALGVGVDDWIKANEVGLQLWSSTDALVLPWAITDALVRADLHYGAPMCNFTRDRRQCTCARSKV